ncbi:MAG: hypothetical protein JWR69_4242 [Pedosphaera sp.]|nr:hypothetical protein [Pedosphaera sp.]
MKALLQQVGTGLFFKGVKEWTPNYQEAYDFKSSFSALGYCQRQGIQNAQIVLKFDRDEYDIILPAQLLPPHPDAQPTSLGA